MWVGIVLICAPLMSARALRCSRRTDKIQTHLRWSASSAALNAASSAAQRGLGSYWSARPGLGPQPSDGQDPTASASSVPSAAYFICAICGKRRLGSCWSARCSKRPGLGLQPADGQDPNRICVYLCHLRPIASAPSAAYFICVIGGLAISALRTAAAHRLAADSDRR